ncbi:Hypothetical predicted protein [Podarcis lilfordi]|uniref:Uncharacterized protein n=1 Tax=Podarcis lilfordi TaxID=74358 RepID=A0AA35K1S5_9SAUR|nr:Hypothetical predicted protein [Podarcis lilfordi]
MNWTESWSQHSRREMLKRDTTASILSCSLVCRRGEQFPKVSQPLKQYFGSTREHGKVGKPCSVNMNPVLFMEVNNRYINISATETENTGYYMKCHMEAPS